MFALRLVVLLVTIVLGSGGWYLAWLGTRQVPAPGGLPGCIAKGSVVVITMIAFVLVSGIQFVLAEMDRNAQEAATAQARTDAEMDRNAQEAATAQARTDAEKLKEQVGYLKSTLAPFREAARAKFSQLGEEQALESLGRNAAKLIPKLEEFTDERMVKPDPERGWATTYVFGSHCVVPLTGISIEIQNDTQMKYVEAVASRVNLGISLSEGILQKGQYSISDDHRTLRISKDFSEVGTKIFVKVFSAQRPTVFTIRLVP